MQNCLTTKIITIGYSPDLIGLTIVRIRSLISFDNSDEAQACIASINLDTDPISIRPSSVVAILPLRDITDCNSASRGRTTWLGDFFFLGSLGIALIF